MLSQSLTALAAAAARHFRKRSRRFDSRFLLSLTRSLPSFVFFFLTPRTHRALLSLTTTPGKKNRLGGDGTSIFFFFFCSLQFSLNPSVTASTLTTLSRPFDLLSPALSSSLALPLSPTAPARQRPPPPLRTSRRGQKVKTQRNREKRPVSLSIFSSLLPPPSIFSSNLIIFLSLSSFLPPLQNTPLPSPGPEPHSHRRPLPKLPQARLREQDHHQKHLGPPVDRPPLRPRRL